MFSPVGFVGFAKNKDQQVTKIAGLSLRSLLPLENNGAHFIYATYKELKRSKK